MEGVNWEDIIQRGTVAQMESMLDENPELLNLLEENMFTGPYNVLTRTLETSSSEKLQLLIDRDAVVENPNFSVIGCWIRNASPFNEKFDKSVLEKLLSHGLKFPTSKEQCRFLLQCELQWSCYRKDSINFYNYLVDHGFDPVASEQQAEINSIEHAIEQHEGKWTCDVITRMLELGCSVEPSKSARVSLIAKAVIESKWHIASALIEYGAPIELHAGRYKFEMDESLCSNKPGKIGFLEKIRDTGYDLNETITDQTLIHLAMQENTTNLLTFLIESKVNLNVLSNGKTPLMVAVETKASEHAKLLLDAGADVNMLSSSGETALDIALKKRGIMELRTLLEQAGAESGAECNSVDTCSDFSEFAKHCAENGEPWVEAYWHSIDEMGDVLAEKWYQLVRFCKSTKSSKPSKKWLAEANLLYSAIGKDDFKAMMLNLLPLLHLNRTNSGQVNGEVYLKHQMSENNVCLMKGLIWLCAKHSDDEISVALRETATHMYKKVHNVGIRNPTIANACVFSLSQMRGFSGVKQIVVLRSQVKHKPALKKINNIFDQLAKSKGTDIETLEAASLPDHGLQEIGRYEEKIGNFVAILKLELGGGCSLVWQSSEKAQKTIPAVIKRDNTSELESIKWKRKDLRAASTYVKTHLEGLFLQVHGLSHADWIDHYYEHKLVAFHARRLIWVANTELAQTEFYCLNDGYVDNEGMKITLPADATITLWHPCKNRSESVQHWRNFLIEQEITQPFKQAHREVYLVTDAERKAGNITHRFQNHILQHSQFHALAVQRGWEQTRGGEWSGGSENSAYKAFPAHGLEVAFDAHGIEEEDPGLSLIYDFVCTGGVEFCTQDNLQLDDLDPQLFSEIMRDVDLFVSVSSISANSDWREYNVVYWDAQFSESLSITEQTRHDVLAALIPRLKIADKLHLSSKFLKVQGKLNTYKIHLKYGHTLMASNDEILSIVPKQRKHTIILPFENDGVLSLILSKAFMLVNDDKIKDEVFIS